MNVDVNRFRGRQGISGQRGIVIVSSPWAAGGTGLERQGTEMIYLTGFRAMSE